MGWDMMGLPGKEIKQCHSLPIGYGMKHDETAWQRNKAVSLTFCWSWDETWLMRFPCTDIKQCHPLSVGYRMKHNWWDCLEKKYSSVTHSLLVMGWNMIDETAWQRNKAVSLTYCWPWDETWLMWLPGKEIQQCHSLPIGHGMKHDWWDCRAKKYSSVTHCLLVMGWNMIDEIALHRHKAVSPTDCWL